LKRNKAIVLVSVLWIIFILTALSLGLAKRIIFIKTHTRNKMDYQKAVYAVRSGLIYSIVCLENDSDKNVDSILDDFWNNPDKFKDKLLVDKTNFSIYLEENESLRYGIEPLNRKLNINYLTKFQKEKILEETDFLEEQIASLMDWIDGDDDPYNHGNGAENDYYEDLGIPYKIKNGPIDSWNELYLIKEMDKEFALFLKNNFSLLGDGKVNINFATSKTLSWFGLSEILIDKINRFFAGIDGDIGTEDDQHFQSLDTLIKDLQDFENLYPEEVSELNKAIPFFTVNSSFFSVKIISSLNSNIYPYVLDALLKRTENEVFIVRSEEKFSTDIYYLKSS
jgi:type II secretory pathway component PulK